MGTNTVQRDDGGVDFVQDADAKVVASIGGAYRSVKVLEIDIAGTADTAGALGSAVNPESGAIIVTNVVLDVTTEATGACTADIGVAADATTLNDTLLDGVNVGAATGVFDSATNGGTNGVTVKKVTAGQYFTASTASGAAADLVGKLYVFYHVI